MGNLSEILLTGGLNHDDDIKYLPKGDYRGARNIHLGLTEEGNLGSGEVPFGNSLISFQLPSGENKCINAIEDRLNSRIFYFIYNSEDNHSIIEYDYASDVVELLMQSSVLGFTETPLRKVDYREDLLFWTDKITEPGKINVKRAKRNKQFRFRLLIEKEDVFSSGTTYSIELLDQSGTSILPSTNILTVANDDNKGDIEEAVRQIVSGINSNSTINQHIKASGCGCFIEATVQNTGYHTIKFTSTNDDTNVVADNFYPDPILDEYIRVIKGPLSCPPELTLVHDEERQTNYIEDKVFQFRTSLKFDDYEESVLGSVSKISIDTSGCSSLGQNENCIEIDLNSQKTQDPGQLAIITGIKLYVREGELGEWSFVETFDLCDFAVGDGKLRFYNDSLYSPISENEADKTFDNVPRKAGTLSIAKDRLFFADILEGYNNVCIESNLEVQFKEPPDIQTFDISGKIFIRNVWASTNDYKLHQPIWNNSNNDAPEPVFGGFGPLDVVNIVGTAYGQTIPLGGFVVYLAGTDFHAVSKQPIDQNPQDSNGVFTGSNSEIRGSITGSSGGSSGETPDTRSYSRFTIEDVPAGKYILRVASHLTTEEDLNSADRSYQKTSTYLWKINGIVQTEIEVDLNGNVDIGKLEILDMTDPGIPFQTVNVDGYVTDKDLSIGSPPTLPELLADTRIELARMLFDNNLNLPGLIHNIYTDHNGFFFFTARNSGVNMKIGQIKINDIDANPTVYDQNGNTLSGNYISGSKTTSIICRASNSQVGQNGRTFIEGKIIDQDTSAGLQGVSIVAKRGDVQSTDITGEYRVVVYGDTRNFDFTGQKRRSDEIIPVIPGFGCFVEFDPSSVAFSVLISSTNYNINNGLTVQDIIANVLVSDSAIGFRPGSNPEFGIVYFDNYERSGVVNESSKTRIHIPFYTEENPDTGQRNPEGIRSVFWEIKHRPPSWATHYQWYRTIDPEEYLQWAVDEVEYLDDDNNVVSFTDGTKVKISIANIGTYSDKHPDSIIGFTPEKTDRVRFIQDVNGNYLDYNDIEVIDVDTDSFTVYNLSSLAEIKQGYLFEIYKPEREVENKLYFEFGECYEVINPGTPLRAHRGQSQNQGILNPDTIPAKGVFQSGDSYHRIRQIRTQGPTKTVFINDPNISDFYKSNIESIGRANVVDKDFEEIDQPNLVRYSGKLFPDTKINQLNSFDSDDKRTIDKDYGPVTCLQLAENVLLAICYFRTASIYIDERLITSREGEDQIAISDQVIGTVRSLKGMLGTAHPNSVAEFEGNVYFYDVNTGEVVRYSNNGLTRLSAIKMSTYFSKRRRDQLKFKSPESINIIGVFDSYFKSYTVFFNSYSEGEKSIEGEAISFSEPKKRWTEFWDVLPEMITSGGDNVIMFKEGTLYESNVNANVLEFFGNKLKSEITVVVNDDPKKIKTFDAMSYESSYRWSVPLVELLPNEKYKSGMKSRVKAKKFVNKEGFFYADFGKDMLSPGFSDQLSALINGRELRGNVMLLTIEYSGDKKDAIFSVNVVTTNSELSRKQF